MPIYMYVARDTAGKAVQGHQEAPTEAVAVSLLQNKGLFVTHVINTATVVKSAKRTRRMHRRVKSEDLLFFIMQTANLLQVGIPFVRSLEVISELIESEGMYQVLQELMKNIRAGSTFKDALARHPKVFPGYWTFLIEAGELSGTLPQVLSQLAKNMEATDALKKKVVSALVYPMVLIIASLGAVVFFMVFIVPIFANLFKSFKADLPAITMVVLTISNFLKNNFLLLIGGGIGGFIMLKNFISKPKGRRLLHVVVLRVPLFGAVLSDVVHARICIILSMLIRSGLSFLKSIEVTANVSGNFVYETALGNVRLEVQQGKTLSTSLAENSIFSPMMVNLVKIGEESGKLPEMIEKASEYFAQRVEIFATRIGVLIEPLIMIFVGGVIGVIGVSIFMPIIKLSSVVR